MSDQMLFDADPALGRTASTAAIESLRGCGVKVVTVPRGRFTPSSYAAKDSLGLMVTGGLLARTVTVPGGTSMELLSDGNLLQPWTVEQPSFVSVSWTALEPVSLYEIDSALSRRLAQHQEILVELMSRGLRRAHVLTVSAAIESVVGVENRVLLALWHLAEFCGSVGRDGVTMPLPLTHELIATIVGSRRPSVTSALASLAAQGLISRRSDSGWLLLGSCPGPMPDEPSGRDGAAEYEISAAGDSVASH